MGLTLEKGHRAKLEELAGGSLSKVVIGLGWDAKPGQQSGSDFDLDASAFIIGSNGLIYQGSADSVVYYNNLTALGGAIEHSGDNLTGDGDGDDETITVDLTRVPSDVQKIIFPVTIFEATERGQNFGMVSNAVIRAVNANDSNPATAELARYQLDDGSFMDSAVVFGELTRGSAGWELRAISNGYAGGLDSLASQYGLS